MDEQKYMIYILASFFIKNITKIPLFARIIHLADTIDIIGNNTGSGNNSWNFICQYL